MPSFFPIATQFSCNLDFYKKKLIFFRVLKTLAIPGDFISRYPLRRTYLYKFAVRKTNMLQKSTDYYHGQSGDIQNHSRLRLKPSRYKLLPLPLQPFVTEISDTFNPEKAEKFFEFIKGHHNFGSFATSTAWVQRIRNKETKTMETVDMPVEYFERYVF
jgi:tRNA U38,U39,U40 pseudouridine synthase TruA